MAEKLMTDGSMALRERQYRVITTRGNRKAPKRQIAGCGIRPCQLRL